MASAAIALIALGGASLLWSNRPQPLPPLRHDMTVVLPDGAAYAVEIADDDRERIQGLSRLPSMAANEGKLFIFPEAGRPAFWMKDMRFPLDILWLRNGIIVDKVLGAPMPGPEGPKGYLPEADADMVLELNADQSVVHGLDLRSRLDIRFPDGYTLPTN